MSADADTDLVLRPGLHEDLPAVADLFVAARLGAVPAMPPIVGPVEGARQFVLGWDLARQELWVAEGADGIVGFANVEADWLNGLYVAPDAARAGVGSALLDVVKGIRPDGFALWVFESNTPARDFYRKHGLTDLERTDGSANMERAPDVKMAWPGRRPAGVLPRPDRRRRRPARRPAGPPGGADPRRPGPQARHRRPSPTATATSTASARSPRRWPSTPPSSAPTASSGSCT